MSRRLPAEWEPQSGILLSLPHAGTDWQPYLDEALNFYRDLIAAIVRHEKVLLVCPDAAEAKKWLEGEGVKMERVIFAELPANDTWARDFGLITVEENGQPLMLDYEFNGWGLKFAANFDNQINSRLYAQGLLGKRPMQKPGWILEGGSIESDGQGTILTTTTCLLSDNRHPHKDRADIEARIKRELGATRVLWLQNGHLENDDTDAHVDTLARFCDAETIAYVGCGDKNDHHYEGLQAMKRELQAFMQANGKPYRLIELPMVDPLFFDGERLPATYANFLILNDAVIAPVYGVASDIAALEALKTAFPKHKIVPLDASVLVRQHGSIHCVTMQIPASVAL
ncbi:MAG: agmatine deiminase family protein [Campylobacterales bacterium]